MSSHFYLFPLKNGRVRLAYGSNVDDAIRTLRLRMTDSEMEEICDEVCEGRFAKEIRQQDIRDYIGQLG